MNSIDQCIALLAEINESLNYIEGGVAVIMVAVSFIVIYIMFRGNK